MTRGNAIATVIAAALLGSCGGGGDDPKSLCKQMFEARLEVFAVPAPDQRREAFMAQCVALDIELLKCDAKGSASDQCAAVLGRHGAEQDALNAILMTGKAPGAAEAERAAAAKSRVDAVSARKASRGAGPCAQTCGALRDVDFEPDEPDAIKDEKACVARCDELVAAGGDRGAFVDEIAVCAKGADMAAIYACIGRVNENWRARGIDDPPQW